METNKDHIRGVIAATCWPHCPPPDWYSSMPRGLVWAYSSSRGRKESPVWTSSTPSIVGHFLAVPIPVLPHRNFRRVCGTWPLGIWLWWRREERLATPSMWILADHISTCNAQVGSPNQQFCSSAEPRQWHGLTKELEYRSAWFGYSKNPACLRARFAPPQRGELTHSSLLSAVPGSTLPERLTQNT